MPFKSSLQEVRDESTLSRNLQFAPPWEGRGFGDAMGFALFFLGSTGAGPAGVPQAAGRLAVAGLPPGRGQEVTERWAGNTRRGSQGYLIQRQSNRFHPPG